MKDTTRVEHHVIFCQEENREANVVVTTCREKNKMKVKGVWCDNPRFQDMHQWECHWSCWKKIQNEIEGR